MNAVETKFQQYLERGYFSVDDQGQVWRHRTRRRGSKRNLAWLPLATPRRAETKAGDYLAIPLELWGRKRTVQAHRAVWIALKGDIPDGLLVNHKDGIKTRNHPSNLELATVSENAIHARDVLGVGPWTRKNPE